MMLARNYNLAKSSSCFFNILSVSYLLTLTCWCLLYGVNEYTENNCVELDKVWSQGMIVLRLPNSNNSNSKNKPTLAIQPMWVKGTRWIKSKGKKNVLKEARWFKEYYIINVIESNL